MLSSKVRATRHSFRPVATAVALALSAAVLAPSLAGADTYPSKPVRVLVPYGAGGIADATMRLVAERLSTKFGQQFFIENRPGAGGVIGMQAAKDAPADGYTITMIGGGLTIAKGLFKQLPYDLENDFTPISTTASYGLVLTTRASSNLKTVKDVIAAAKAKPGTLNFGSINPGSTQNLSAQLFKTMSGIDVIVVPYKTSPDLATAILRGDVDVGFDYYAAFQASITNNQMSVIATTGPTRASNLPDVPTVIEGGLPEYDVTSWNGLAVRTGTPPEIIATLHKAVDEALKSPAIQKFSTEAGMDAQSMTPADLSKRIKSDVAKWQQVIENAGIPKR